MIILLTLTLTILELVFGYAYYRQYLIMVKEGIHWKHMKKYSRLISGLFIETIHTLTKSSPLFLAFLLFLLTLFNFGLSIIINLTIDIINIF
jgi:hypothetical protein